MPIPFAAIFLVTIPFLVGPGAVMTNSTSLISEGLDVYISRRHDRDTPSPRQPLCHCTCIPGQWLLWTSGNTEPGGSKTSQMGGCLHHQFGRRRMSPYQPLYSDPEGSFTVSLPTALTLRALTFTTARAQSRFSLFELISCSLALWAFSPWH